MAKKTLEEEILEELENEKQEKKARPKKAKKPKADKAPNALIKPLLLLILCLWLGALLFIGGIKFGILNQINNTASQQQIEAISKGAKAGVNQQFANISNQLNSLANSETIKNTLLMDNPDAINGLQEMLIQSFSYSESLLIIPWDHTGTVGLKKRNIPLRNSIEMSMIAKVGDKKEVIPEAYLADKTWLISFVAPVMNENAVIGALLLTVNKGFLDDFLKQSAFTENTSLEIINKQQSKTITKAGTITSAQPGHFALPFNGGELVVHISTSSSETVATLFLIIYIVVAFGAVFMTILALVIYRLNIRALKQDCETITRYAQSQIGIHKTKKPRLVVPDLTPIVEAIDSLSSHVAKSSVTPHRADSGNIDLGGNDKTVISPSIQAGPPPTPLAKADVNEDNSFDHPEIFRDYDIRGHAEGQLTPENVIMIGKAIGSEAAAQGIKNIVVGRDGRLSGERIKKNLIKGLCSTGCNVVDIDLVPTPVLYYATKKLGTDAGVMITGSHNAPDYNGFKIILGGKTLQGVQILNLLKRIEEYNITQDRGTFSSHNILDEYIEEICMDIIIAKPLKVVVDGSNGVGGETATRLLQQLDCEVIPLHCNIDGNFPGHGPDPSAPESLSDLVSSVTSNSADLGIAFDGDADRMVAVTSDGKIVEGDTLLMIFAKDIVSRNPAADVIFDIKCSSNLSRLVTEFGGRPIQCKSGHSHIKAKMQETGALLGGEYTGHYFFKERWHGFDDGIYSALRLVELLTTDEESLSDRISALPTSFTTSEILLAVDSEVEKQQILNSVKQTLAGEDGNVNTLDGIRIDYENGWGLIRASNTSKNISTRFEANSPEELARIQGVFKQALLAAKPGLSLPF